MKQAKNNSNQRKIGLNKPEKNTYVLLHIIKIRNQAPKIVEFPPKKREAIVFSTLIFFWPVNLVKRRKEEVTLPGLVFYFEIEGPSCPFPRGWKSVL